MIQDLVMSQNILTIISDCKIQTQIVAWAGMRLEVNFSECAILGMVGAGGVGYVISNRLQGYDYGTAGVAILLVFLVAYCIERVFVRIKKKFY